MTSIKRRRSAHPASRRLAQAAAALAAVSILGCSAAETPLIGFEDMPAVEPAPGVEWPRLADAPAPAPTDGPGSLSEQVARGDAIDASLAADVAALRARSAELRSEPVLRRNLNGDAARLRRRAASAFN